MSDKIVILGDTHFGARGDSPIFQEYFRRFYDEVFFPYLKENNIVYVIQLGDVFDRRKFINYQTLKIAKECFFEPLNRDYTSWVLVGNHDTYYKNTNDVNSIDLLLETYHNINAIQKPTEIEFDEQSILLMPWICQDNFIESKNAMDTSKAQIAMGHFEIKGFEMHRGSVCDTGMSTAEFDKFDMVMSGHFHTKSRSGNITYVGTPYEMTWADHDDIKGFHVLDLSKRELTFIKNPLKMYKKVFYDDLNKSMDEVLAKYSVDYFKDSIVKVVIKNKTNPYWFDVFIERIEKSGVYDLQVVEDHLNLNLEDDADIVNEAEDTLTILNKYVDQLDIKVEKSKLENLLRNLYNEALSMEIS